MTQLPITKPPSPPLTTLNAKSNISTSTTTNEQSHIPRPYPAKPKPPHHHPSPLSKPKLPDSWQPTGRTEASWAVGWEQSTSMFVKRKGRGTFEFERAMGQGYGGVWEGVDDVEGVSGRSAEQAGRIGKEERFRDGFAYREWSGQVDSRKRGRGSRD